jgi:hypothetical protein
VGAFTVTMVEVVWLTVGSALSVKVLLAELLVSVVLIGLVFFFKGLFVVRAVSTGVINAVPSSEERVLLILLFAIVVIVFAVFKLLLGAVSIEDMGPGVFVVGALVSVTVALGMLMLVFVERDVLRVVLTTLLMAGFVMIVSIGVVA